MARPAGKSANPRAQRARETAQQRSAEEAHRQAYARAVRQRRMVGWGVVIAVVVAAIFTVRMATSESNKSAQSTASVTTTVPASTSSTVEVNPGPAAALPVVAPGASITGATPCPPADGSAPRTTQFAQPPPMCIDPAKDYEARIRTSAGDLVTSLSTTFAPNSVNNFVTLARYHYYDGLPFTRVVPRAWAEVADPKNADGTPGPGYTIPGEAPETGSVATPLVLAMIPGTGGASSGGFLIGLANQVQNMPKNATHIGLIRDSRVDQSPGGEMNKTVQQVIDRAGTQSGQLAEVITITGIEITEEPRK